MFRYIFVISFFIVSLFSFPAVGQNVSPYKVTPEVEAPITFGMFAAAGIPRLLNGPPAYCGLECNPGDVNILDRVVIGNHSREAGVISDATFVAGMFLPYALATIDTLASHPDDGWGGYGTDILVISETLVATLAINNVIDLAIRRPRPLVYDSVNFTEAERLDNNAALSFPSGHTSSLFALGTVYSRLYMLRHPDSPLVVPIWVGTYSLGITTGISRVLAGKHFWTDVLAGASLGIATGLLIPWMHEVEDKKMSIMPRPYNKGAGLTVSIF